MDPALQAALEDNALLRARVLELEAQLAAAQAGFDHALGGRHAGGKGSGRGPDAFGYPVTDGAAPPPTAFSGHLAELRMQLERTRAERDALAAELEGLRSSIEDFATHHQQLMPLTSRTNFSNLSLASGHRATSAHSVANQSTALSFRSVQSQWSGLRAVSSTSLESIAAWVFAVNPQNIRPMKTYERVNIPQGDPRRNWLEDYMLASLQPHRRAYNSDEWCPVPEIRIMNVQEVINDMASAPYRQELGQLKASREGDRTVVSELEHAICVRTDLAGPRLNEALLFHGCRWESVFAILREGFDSRLGGTNAGAAFGIGSYFSTVASKADLYTQKWEDWQRRPPIKVPPQLRCLVIARVALGEAHEMRTADPGLRRPPIGADGVRSESVLGVPRGRGGVVDYDEFVIYKPAQAMAQFVVKYEHVETCACRTCASPGIG